MLKIKKFNWIEGASPLLYFNIYKYIGPTILGKQADVQLIYKSGKSVRIYGDEGEVFSEAKKRLSKKTNIKERERLTKNFEKSWVDATVYGYSEYKKLSGNKNPIATLDPLKNLKNMPERKVLEKLQESVSSIAEIKAMQNLINDHFYKNINPAKLIDSKLSEKGWDRKDLADEMQKLGEEESQKQSTTYTHLSGERAVSRDVAIRYGKILDCDPVDLMFAKKTTVVWGKVNTKKGVETYKQFVPGEVYSYSADSKDLDTVIVPRDIWKKNIKAIKIDARGTMYDQHVAFYYYSNAKDQSCINKLCVVGAKTQHADIDPDCTEINYYLGLYENDKGTSNLINVDPFVKEKNKYILKDFEPTFISPVVCVVNPQAIVDETKKQSVVPESEYRKEEMLVAELHKVREQLKEAKQTSERTMQTQKETEQLHKETGRIMNEVRLLQDRLLRAEQETYIKRMEVLGEREDKIA
jgi:hypothetical protein